MTLTKAITYTLIICSICACGTGLKISKKNFRPVNTSIEGSFSNQAYQITGKADKLTLLELFNIFDGASDNINIITTSNGALQVSYQDSLSNKRFETFEGDFTKQGNYEIYLRKEIKSIPPLIPIISGHRNIDRIRIAYTNNNNLVIDHKWERTANVFLMAGGGNSRLQYFFGRLGKNIEQY